MHIHFFPLILVMVMLILIMLGISGKTESKDYWQDHGHEDCEYCEAARKRKNNA